MIVWERPDRGARGPVPARSRAQLTAVAIRLADAGGLPAVSVRQVAREWGTGPASLYRYVTGRDDLIDLMTDAATGEMDLSAPLTGDPVEDLTGLALQARQIHLRHPWYLDIPSEPLRLGPRGLDYLEHALRALAPAPLSGQAKLEGIALLSSMVAALTRAELQGRATPTDRQQAQAAYLATAASDGHHPFLAEAMTGEPAAPLPETPQALFERLIRRILTGLTT